MVCTICSGLTSRAQWSKGAFHTCGALHWPCCLDTVMCGITRLAGCCHLLMVVITIRSRIVCYSIIHSLPFTSSGVKHRRIFKPHIGDFISISVGSCTILSRPNCMHGTLSASPSTEEIGRPCIVYTSYYALDDHRQAHKHTHSPYHMLKYVYD